MTTRFSNNNIICCPVEGDGLVGAGAASGIPVAKNVGGVDWCCQRIVSLEEAEEEEEEDHSGSALWSYEELFFSRLEQKQTHCM